MEVHWTMQLAWGLHDKSAHYEIQWTQIETNAMHEELNIDNNIPQKWIDNNRVEVDRHPGKHYKVSLWWPSSRIRLFQQTQ